MKKELSVFIDESGDFGPYAKNSPFYIIGMVFHDQSKNISRIIKDLDNSLCTIDFCQQIIHAGPIIRREGEFNKLNRQERIRILRRLVIFTKKAPCQIKIFHVDKKDVKGRMVLADKLTKDMTIFFEDHLEYFLNYNQIKIYYDHGQKEVAKIITAVFSSLFVNSKIKNVSPSEYRLFQVADLACTAKLLELKQQNKALSKSEIKFFGNSKNLKKLLIDMINKKKIT